MSERQADRTIHAALEAVASHEPAPGGGAVAAMAGALAAALGRMAAAFSIGKKTSEADAAAISDLSGRLERAQRVLLELADDDAEAFSQLAAIEKLPAGDARREHGLASAATRAATVPLAIIATSGSALGAAEELAPRCNRWLRNDLRICAILAQAAARSASEMVDANLGALERYAGTEAASQIAGERDRLIIGCERRLGRILEIDRA